MKGRRTRFRYAMTHALLLRLPRFNAGPSALPVQDLVREMVIAHVKQGLHRVYDQFAYLDEKRQRLDLWEKRLRTILRPPNAATTDVSSSNLEV